MRDMNETLALMNERRFETNKVYQPVAVEKFPALTREVAPMILGSFSRTNTIKKWKLIDKRHAYSLGAGWVSPADIARDYLAVSFPKWRGRVCTSQYHSTVKAVGQQPQHYVKCSGEGAYLDMKSAYWQILKAGGWNVDYSRGRFLLGGADIRDFPSPEIKLARNSLVSCCLSGGMSVWDGEKITTTKQTSKQINLVLYAFVMDVLNTVAYEMLQAGAVYINTDGYIMPDHAIDHAFEIADSWGIELVVKDQGHYRVRGIGNYEIDGRSAGIGRTTTQPEWTKIVPQDVAWLKTRYRWLVDHRKNS